jgi:hypothetical protein
MSAAHIDLDSLVEELFAILDADIEYIEAVLTDLNELRAGVIKRDETALEQLLESIGRRQNKREVIENRRQAFRHAAAVILRCRCGEVNLSRFMAHLPMTQREKAAQQKTKLEQMVNKLKKEYMATAILLNECSRFNRMLIDGILGSCCRGPTMYNAGGMTQRQDGSGFVTLQF